MEGLTSSPKALEASRDDPSSPILLSSQRQVSLLSEYESLLTTSLSGALQSLEGILEEYGESSDMSSWSPTTKYDRMLEDDYLALVSHRSEATNKTAAAILQIIGLSGTKLASRLSWERVSNEVKAFLVHRFVLESVVGFVSKLRKECHSLWTGGGGEGGGSADCKCSKKVEVNLSGGDRGVAECKGNDQCRLAPEVKGSVQKLLYATECLVDNMVILLDEEQGDEGQRCLYSRIARDISDGRHQADLRWLGDFIFYHLKPVEEHAVHTRAELESELDAFVHSLLEWLREQAQEHVAKIDAASGALLEIQKVEADLLELNKCSLVKKGERSRPLVGPKEEKKFEPISEEPVEAPAPEMYEVYSCDEATVLINQGLEELCGHLVGGVMDKILEELMVVVSWNMVTGIRTTLKDMLVAELADGNVDVHKSAERVKGIVKAAYRDLISKKPGPQCCPLALLAEDPVVLSAITETLTKHLLQHRNRSRATKFFESLCKPVTTCLLCND